MSKTKEDYITRYKYIGKIERVIEVLQNQRLYLDDGSNFNDPFELLIADDKRDVNKRIEGLHMLCLTGGFQAKLMWSHYANAHRGVCIAVEVPKAAAYPICYTSKRIFCDSDIDKIIAKSVDKMKKRKRKDYGGLSRDKKIALIKDKKWESEKEYRLVFDEDDEKDLINEDGKWFYGVKIKTVYLGACFDKNEDKLKEEVLNLCDEMGVVVKKMQLSAKRYSLAIMT